MDAVTAWADASLADRGVGRTGDIELNRARPWSTTWRVPTELGTVWLKAGGRGGHYEAGLTALLGQVAPEWTLQPLAVDIERGWLLLPDGGPDLRSALAGADPDVVTQRWRSVVTEYAALQRRMADFVPHLRAVDVPALTPASAPARLLELVDDHAAQPLRGRLLAGSGRFDEVCDRLAASAVPMTLQHDDLHAGSVFGGPDGSGAPAFFDWGDAMVSHPFATLLVTRRMLALTLQVEETDAAVSRVTDAYLECWSDLAPIAQLRDELPDVLQLARVGRAWSWARAMLDATAADFREWDDPVAGWLAELVG